MFVNFQRLEFEDRYGVVRTFYGCSVAGIFEFNERLSELRALTEDLPEDTSIEQAYHDKKQVRHIVHRLLTLNGIDPDWVTWLMVSQLLFGRLQDGKVTEGWLITLNTPKSSKPKPSENGISIDSRTAAIAALALHCDSLKEAYELAENTPANELWDVLGKKAEFMKSPEERLKEKEDAQFDDWKKKKLERLKRAS